MQGSPNPHTPKLMVALIIGLTVLSSIGATTLRETPDPTPSVDDPQSHQSNPLIANYGTWRHGQVFQ